VTKEKSFITLAPDVGEVDEGVDGQGDPQGPAFPGTRRYLLAGNLERSKVFTVGRVKLK
jgi:hypothetical protein